MDVPNANSDAQNDVNIMITDYMLCISLNRILLFKEAERNQAQSENSNEDWETCWLIDTLRVINTILPSIKTLPDDLRSKIQLFKLINVVHRYCRQMGQHSVLHHEVSPTEPWEVFKTQAHELSLHTYDHSPSQRQHFGLIHTGLEHGQIFANEIAVEFMMVCKTAGTRLSEVRQAEIIEQLIKQAVCDEYETGARTLASLESLVQMAENLHKTKKWKKATETHVIHLMSLRHASDATPTAYLDIRHKKWPLHHIESMIYDFLSDLMQVLNPPVLIQLERGKLDGLNHQETRELKNRLGLR